MLGPESVTETMSETPDSLLDQDDVAYPCKGCGEVGVGALTFDKNPG